MGPQAGEDASLSLEAVVAVVGRPLRRPWVDPCRPVILGGLVSPWGWLLYVWLVEALGREGLCILIHESSCHINVVVVVSPLLSEVAALDEELVRPVIAEVGSEGDTVWSTRRSRSHAQRARFLRCTCLHVKADSSYCHDGWLVRHGGFDPSSGLGLVRHGAGQPPNH